MININLIAERRKRRQQEQSILRMSMLGVVLIFFAMAALNLTWWSMVAQDQKSVEVARENAEKSEKALKEFQSLQRDVEGKQKVVDLLVQVRVSEGAWMTVLADLTRSVPANVVITNITSQNSDDGVELRLNGKALDEETIGVFLRTISRHSWVEGPPKLGHVAYEEPNLQTGLRRAVFDASVPINGLYGGNL